jgi:hypothetical protein
MRNGKAASLAAMLTVAAGASAQEVEIEFEGWVFANNHTSGSYVGIEPGAPITMTMTVDAPPWLTEFDPWLERDAVAHYALVPNTFAFTAGGLTTTNNNNVAIDARTFSIWNDWPVADGFIADLALIGPQFETYGFHMELHNQTGDMFETLDLTQEGGAQVFGAGEGETLYNLNTWRLVENGEYFEGRITSMTINAPCTADIDGNGAVGFSDLSSLLGVWGCVGCIDLDGDGVAGFTDLTILLGAWGDCN